MEEFRDIPGYEGHYQVSNLGNVKGFYRNKEYIMKQSIDKYGYLQLTLYINSKQKCFRTHKLVMLAFKPDEYFEYATCNHRNGIKTDNRLENLEWCTVKENNIHAHSNGLKKMPKGSKHHRAKLNEKIVSIIRMSYSNRYFKQKELANIFNVSNMVINRIVNNKAWTHV